jgi:type III pantothenate kinase
VPELLLVGNSRWHWAERRGQRLHCWHEDPPALAPDLTDLRLWAAVGAVPEGLQLPADRQLQLQQVPLHQAPPWLGLDRALAGWMAWHQQEGPVLVVDAGTCLSLTCIDAAGQFLGGRLSPGLALQLGSLGRGTARLPLLEGQVPAPPAALWPQETGAAMVQGCLRAMAGAVVQAVADLPALDAAGATWSVWLTGGDGPQLAPLLPPSVPGLHQAPDLCMEALAALAFS